MNLKYFIVIGLFALIVSCGSKESATTSLGLVSECDSAISRCEFDNGLVKASLQLGDGSGIGELKGFAVDASINPNPDEVIISFMMKDMDMGPNRYRLKQSHNRWEGKAILPMCALGRLDWIAQLEWRSANKKYQIEFPFHSEGKVTSH